MYLFNEALKCIEATEPNVLSVHRCSESLFLAPQGRQQQQCEAFLCVVREDGEGQEVYPALYLSRSKETLIYSPDPARQPAPGSDSVRPGLDFLKEMGFTMQPVNLGGNPALRQVVLSGIKVLKPPAPQSRSARTAPSDIEALPFSTAPQGAAGTGAATKPPVKAPVPPDPAARQQAELARVNREKATREAFQAARIAELEGELAAARVELARQAAANLQPAAPTKDDAADGELALLREDYQALRAEYGLINEELTERQTLLQQLESAREAEREAMAQEIAALKATIRQLSSDRMRSAKSANVPPSDSGQDWPDPDGSVAPDQQAGTGPVAAVSFRYDPALAMVPCRSHSEIIDLRVSFNTIRMTCAGAKAQNCAAYIVGLERSGVREVYLGIWLSEDMRAAIYVPERQPQDSAGYDRVIDGALSFTELSGFIIHLESLGGGVEARAKTLQQVPVLGKG